MVSNSKSKEVCIRNEPLKELPSTNASNNIYTHTKLRKEAEEGKVVQQERDDASEKR